MGESKTRWINNKYIVALLAVFCALLWGSAYPSVKIGYELFGMSNSGSYDKMLFAGIRFILSGILVIISMSIIKRKFLYPKPKNILKIILLGLTQTGIQYAFFYVGISNTSGSKSAIIQGTATFLTVLFSALVYKNDRLNFRKVFGCLIGFIGVIIINLKDEFGGLDIMLQGEGFLFFASIFFAVGSVLSKWILKEENGAAVAGYQLVFGGTFLFVIGLLKNGRIPVVTTGGLTMLAYLVLLSALAYTLWTMLLSANPVSSVSIYYSFVPVFGVILSGLFLHEQILNWRNLLALSLVCIAIYIVNISTTQRLAVPDPSKPKQSEGM